MRIRGIRDIRGIWSVVVHCSGTLYHGTMYHCNDTDCISYNVSNIYRMIEDSVLCIDNFTVYCSRVQYDSSSLSNNKMRTVIYRSIRSGCSRRSKL